MKATIHTLPVLNGRELVLRAESAAFDVSPTASDQPSLRVYRGDVLVDVRETDTRVDVHFSTSSGWFGGHTDAAVCIPSGSRVRLSVGYGPVRAAHLVDVDFTFDSGSGAVDMQDISGSIRVRTLAGAVRVERIRGAFDIETAAGAIRLGVLDLVAGVHSARTYVGAIVCDLREDLEAALDLSASFGAVHSKFRSTPESKTRISLRTDVGAVRVRGITSAERHMARPSATSDWQDTWVEKMSRFFSGAPIPASKTSERAHEQSLARVLERVADGSLSVDDADRLLASFDNDAATDTVKKDKP